MGGGVILIGIWQRFKCSWWSSGGSGDFDRDLAEV